MILDSCKDIQRGADLSFFLGNKMTLAGNPEVFMFEWYRMTRLGDMANEWDDQIQIMLSTKRDTIVVLSVIDVLFFLSRSFTQEFQAKERVYHIAMIRMFRDANLSVCKKPHMNGDGFDYSYQW
jgi:hypothetical protein